MIRANTFRHVVKGMLNFGEFIGVISSWFETPPNLEAR
jgi:hypothetical protein